MQCPVGVVFYASCIELAQFPVTARGCSGVCEVDPRARQLEVTFSRLSLATPEGGRELIMHSGGAGKARFNVATPTNTTVTCTAYVLPYNFQTKSI